MTTFWGVSLSISLATSVAPLHDAKVGVEFVMSKVTTSSGSAAKQLTKYLRPLSVYSDRWAGVAPIDSAVLNFIPVMKMSIVGPLVGHPVSESLKTTLLADHM